MLILSRRGVFQVQSFVRVYLAAAGLTMANSYTFPSTMEEFGYAFNKDGQLKKLNPSTGETTDQGYVFKVRDDHNYNQLRYEALGKAIEEKIYEMLVKDEGLQKFPIPVDPEDDEPGTFIFASPDLLDDEARGKPLLVLIHGSGVVRAGQWARRLIINDCLETGTQIPYIRRGKELGYQVVVFNTNDNTRGTRRGVRGAIRGSESPQSHAAYAWDNYVMAAKPSKIAIVAHSFGGVCTSMLASQKSDEFKKRVFAVAFTDSAHHGLQGSNFEHLRTVGRNWEASDEQLDAILEEANEFDMMIVSAGHTQHEMTSASAFESVFTFIEQMRLKFEAKQEADEEHKTLLKFIAQMEQEDMEEEAAQKEKQLKLEEKEVAKEEMVTDQDEGDRQVERSEENENGKMIEAKQEADEEHKTLLKIKAQLEQEDMEEEAAQKEKQLKLEEKEVAKEEMVTDQDEGDRKVERSEENENGKIKEEL